MTVVDLTSANPDLEYALAIFARPLPETIAERRAHPGILLHKFHALRMFKNMLEEKKETINFQDIRAAINCTIQIMTSKSCSGNTDRKEAVIIYNDLLALRPEDVSAKSLDTLFEVIRTCANDGSNYLKWMGCKSALEETLLDLQQSIDQSGFTPNGIRAESLPDLAKLVFKDVMNKILDEQTANSDAVSYYIDLVALDDGRINARNLRAVAEVIDKEKKQANFSCDEYGQKIWNMLADKLAEALETSRWKPAIDDPAPTVRKISKIVEDNKFSDYQIMPVAVRMLKIVDANVGVTGEFWYERIPLETLDAAHDALLTRIRSEPISNLTEQFHRSMTTGSRAMFVTA